MPPKEYLFLDQKRQLKLVSGIRKQITKFEKGQNNLILQLADYECMFLPLVKFSDRDENLLTFLSILKTSDQCAG
jgi:hypothetical protein